MLPALVSACLLVAATACGATPIVPVLPGQSGAELYAAQGCGRCHGDDGSSAFFLPGPDLRGIGAHWTRADLAAYFADPPAWVQRVPSLRGRSMPAYAHLDEAARLALADHVLELSP